MLQDGYIDMSRKILLLHIVHDIAMVSVFLSLYARALQLFMVTILTRSMWHVNW